MDTMRAVVFRSVGDIRVEEVPRPRPRAGQAVIRMTTTTICGTDVHIVKGEYPVKPGLVLGHEPVGVIDELGAGLEGEYHVGQRVVVGAITPCGQCFYCLNGVRAQCGGPIGGWRFGNTIDGAWAEYLLVPDARANLAVIPEGLTDEDVLLVPDMFSTGLSGAESGEVKSATWSRSSRRDPSGSAQPSARSSRALPRSSQSTRPERLAMARQLGATATIDFTQQDPIAAIKRLSGGRGADVAIQALGRQETFENALRSLRPGGILSSLGVYSGKLAVPYDAFYAGLGDQRIVTTLCPGEGRMRRLMAMIAARRVDLTPLVTHRFALDNIAERTRSSVISGVA